MTPSPLSQYWQAVVERLPEGFTETSRQRAKAKSVLTFSDFAAGWRDIAHPELTCRTGIRIAAG